MLFKFFVVFMLCLILGTIIANIRFIVKLINHFNDTLDEIQEIENINYLKLWAEYYMAISNDKIEEDSTLYKNIFDRLHSLNKDHGYGLYNSTIDMIIQIEYNRYNVNKNFNLSEIDDWVDTFDESDLYSDNENYDYYDDLEDGVDYDELEEDSINYDE